MCSEPLSESQLKEAFSHFRPFAFSRLVPFWSRRLKADSYLSRKTNPRHAQLEHEFVPLKPANSLVRRPCQPALFSVNLRRRLTQSSEGRATRRIMVCSG